MQFANYNGMIAIENPIGIMSRIWRKPDQIIQPYYFGDPYPKKTCLWLNGLPLLIATNMVEPEYVIYKSKKTKSGVSKYSFMGNMPTSGSNEKARSIRSKTASGIADAMADQWLNL